MASWNTAEISRCHSEFLIEWRNFSRFPLNLSSLVNPYKVYSFMKKHRRLISKWSRTQLKLLESHFLILTLKPPSPKFSSRSSWTFVRFYLEHLEIIWLELRCLASVFGISHLPFLMELRKRYRQGLSSWVLQAVCQRCQQTQCLVLRSVHTAWTVSSLAQSLPPTPQLCSVLCLLSTVFHSEYLLKIKILLFCQTLFTVVNLHWFQSRYHLEASVTYRRVAWASHVLATI